MQSKDILPLLKKAYSEWSEDKASRLAASLAYYTAVSIAPLLVLAVTVLKWLNLNGQQIVMEQMGMLMGSKGVETADMVIKSAKSQSGTMATIISLIVLIFGASGVFGELQDSMNTVWEVQPKPSLSVWDIIKARFFSLTLVFGVIFLMLVSMFISTVLSALVQTVAGNGKVVGLILDVVLSLIVYSGVFVLLFKYLPDVKISFHDVWRGAIATAVLFTIGKYLLTLYLTKGSSASAYGAAGSLAALLIWVYYSAQILFFGAEFTQVYARKYGSRIQPTEIAVPVTEERRAQQGLVREHDLQTAAKAEEADAAKRGAVFGEKSLTPQPRIVTITRPAAGTGKAYAIAGSGLVAGFVVATVGWIVGKRLGSDGRVNPQVASRLTGLEARARGRLKNVQRRVELQDRFNALEQRVRQTTERVRRHHEPTWWERIGDLVAKN